MGRLALRGATLLDPERPEPAVETLLVEGERIADRLPGDAPVGEDWQVVELPGRSIAPGFIDLHFHGELFGAPVERFPQVLERDASRMLRGGTTAFLATTVAWPHERLGASVSALVDALGNPAPGGAECLGLHLEGPWISARAPGALDADSARAYSAGRDDEIFERAGRALRMVTLAPELPGATELLDALVRRDVVAALGHTRAEPEAIDAGVARGLRHVTHLFNAMGPMHHRAPGVPGSVLTRDALSCDLICDGHHVHRSMVDLAARALGERLILISDRVDLPGMEDVPRAEGEPARLPDGTLAGSQLALDGAVRNVRRFASLGACEAVAACTLRPARLLGMENERGTLRPGARADLAILDAAGRAVETWIAGRPQGP
ncbi:MAG: N-acetylglucosamine-6-phosphate deacetylase [Myxococcota bacterium]